MASPTPSLTNPNPKREGETLDTIRQWCEETFGPISTARIVERAGEEFDELRAEPENVTEAADVVICLSRFPGLWAEIERKMKINRGRRWRLVGDGTGYHIKDGSAASTAPALVPAASARPSPGDPVRAALEALVKSLDDLIAESEGVAGLHRNGDVATWEELISGGRFEEWLSSLDAARAALSVPTPTGEGVTWEQALLLASRAIHDRTALGPDGIERHHLVDRIACAICFAARAHPQQRGERDGWKLVPPDPTEQMIDACLMSMRQTEGYVDKRRRVGALYRWMLSAAPLPPSKSSGEEA